MTEKIAGHLLVECLLAQGVTHAFGVPGESYLIVLDGFHLYRNQLTIGTCRTCIGQLVSGQVVYEMAWPGLTSEEKAEGCVLPCVARPLSDVVLQ
ncbi:MAG: 2Fe-2S iron-sulfur cluster-binding protein, partial [Burkholderiales bacterium]